MVAKPNRLEGAARAIHAALQGLLSQHKGNKIRIVENEWGHLSVVVGSDKFKTLAGDDRADLVWEHLRSTLDQNDFGRLSEVTVLDLEEYRLLLDVDAWINRAAGGAQELDDDSL